MKLTRRTFVGLAGSAAMAAMAGSALAGCSSEGSNEDSSEQSTSSEDFDITDWDSVLEAAKGQTVNWYGWGGSEPRNEWIDTVVAPQLLEKYEVTLERVEMDASDFVTKLSDEMQAGTDPGSIDFMWINGENFYTVKSAGYLYGPFCEYLPNYQDYIDDTDPEMLYDFGEAIEGYEAPYGKAQMTVWADSAVVAEDDFPKTPDEFLEFCKANPGLVTYPEPGDFTGTAFISCLMAGVIGDEWDQLASMEADEDAVKEVIEPGLEYLRELNPYLWQEGASFPSDSSTLDQMFADGEVLLNMDYGFPTASIEDGTLPDTVRSFVFDTGTVGNTNFMAIAANAPNKAAALVAINEVMDPEIQLTQFEDLATMTVLDLDKLDEDQLAAFNEVPTNECEVPLDELLSHRLVEANGAVIPVIEEIWANEVLGQ